MTETAKKCLIWAIVLIIVGSAIEYLPTALWPSPYGTPGYLAFSIALSVVSVIRTAAVAIGAALFGAAIVINVLSPKPSQEDERTDDDA